MRDCHDLMDVAQVKWSISYKGIALLPIKARYGLGANANVLDKQKCCHNLPLGSNSPLGIMKVGIHR